MKTALITGATGQDGSYMIDFLSSKGYDVHALIRRTNNHHAIRELLAKRGVNVHDGDMTDPASLSNAVQACTPDEVYNYAAQSHVGTSFQQPDVTFATTGKGAVDLMRAVTEHAPDARFYQASSSEMFGHVGDDATALSLDDPFSPVSPYGHAKLHAHQAAQRYRDQGHHFSCGVAFNHESERRHPSFVTRKITRSLARMESGLQDTLELGNLEAVRDWGYAPEYVDAAWKLLQHDEPMDVVLCRGEGWSVQGFLDVCLKLADVDPDKVLVDESLKRPTDIHRLVGDPQQAKDVLGWEARVGIEELAGRMLDHDRKRLGSA